MQTNHIIRAFQQKTYRSYCFEFESARAILESLCQCKRFGFIRSQSEGTAKFRDVDRGNRRDPETTICQPPSSSLPSHLRGVIELVAGNINFFHATSRAKEAQGTDLTPFFEVQDQAKSIPASSSQLGTPTPRVFGN